MPPELIRAFGILKKSLRAGEPGSGKLPAEEGQADRAGRDEVIAGKWNDQFPRGIWQTGSGTQTNMT